MLKDFALESALKDMQLYLITLTSRAFKSFDYFTIPALKIKENLSLSYYAALVYLSATKD